MAHGGSSATTAAQQALAVLDGVITGQATVLSFEHAFRIIVLLFLATLIAMPFLPRKVNGGAAAPVEH